MSPGQIGGIVGGLLGGLALLGLVGFFLFRLRARRRAAAAAIATENTSKIRVGARSFPPRAGTGERAGALSEIAVPMGLLAVTSRRREARSRCCHRRLRTGW